MKIAEMKNLMESYRAEITESELLQKCIKITKELGTVNRHTGSFYTLTDREYEKDDLTIKFGNAVFGDHKIQVEYQNELVLDAMELVALGSKYPNPVVKIPSTEVTSGNFEIRTYKPGDWKDTIEDVMYELTTDIRSELLEDITKRFEVEE